MAQITLKETTIQENNDMNTGNDNNDIMKYLYDLSDADWAIPAREKIIHGDEEYYEHDYLTLDVLCQFFVDGEKLFDIGVERNRKREERESAELIRALELYTSLPMDIIKYVIPPFIWMRDAIVYYQHKV